MKLILILAFFLVGMNSSAQTVTQAEVLKELPNIFKTQIYKDEEAGMTFASQEINELPDDNIFAELTNKNMLYLDYILVNQLEIDQRKLDDTLQSFKSDSTARNSFFIEVLQNNERFKKYFLEMSYYYLQSKGISISDYSPQPKLRITTTEFMDIASKFFYAAGIEDGMLYWKICVGWHGFKNISENSMKPLIEGFAFMAIAHNGDEKFAEHFNEMSEKFTKESREIKDSEKRLESLRTKMFAEMAKNESLKTVLKREYEKKKSMLNFELID